MKKGQKCQEKDRQHFSRYIGEAVKEIFSLEKETNYVFVGGDTLLEAMEQIHCKEILPEKEIVPGVVACRAKIGQETMFLVSKSGGLGEKNVFLTIANYLEQQGNKKEAMLGIKNAL